MASAGAQPQSVAIMGDTCATQASDGQATLQNLVGCCLPPIEAAVSFKAMPNTWFARLSPRAAAVVHYQLTGCHARLLEG
jgi:hypothetical protein